jgi:hypothetical protein
MNREQRKEKRIVWDRPGAISSLVGKHIINCIVKDISPRGARPLVPMPEVLPDYFRLDYGDQAVQPKCAIRWRKGNKAGVKFLPE